MQIKYGSYQEIENIILNIEDKSGIFLIEPKKKDIFLVSSFDSGKSEEVPVSSLESFLDDKQGTYAFFIGVRPPKCINPCLGDRYHIKEAIDWCEKIMHLSIGNPSYDKIDYCLESVLAIMREVDDECEAMYELLKASEDRQEEMDYFDLDLFDNQG